jgi:hypothetical protein
MSSPQPFLELAPGGPEYVGWRSRILAELALARVPELTVFKDPPGQEYELVVATDDGLFFQVGVRGFSSFRTRSERIEAIPELRWPVPAREVRRARRNLSPVVLFLFDADRDHGRYARLDVLPAPARGAKSVTVSFAVSDVLTRDGVERLVTELRASRRQMADSSAA